MKATFVVFGASSGYGRGISEALLQMGFDVVGCSRTPCDPATVTQWIQCDVTDPVQVLEVAIKLDKYNIAGVVYSAGIAIGKQRVDQKKDFVDWSTVLKTNTIGLIQTANVFYSKLKESKGFFIHVGSIANSIQYPGGVDYCASKAAASSIMRGLRLEWLGTGIRTTSIEPGLGNTNFQIARYGGDLFSAQKHTGNIKLLEPDDLGTVVSFLLMLPPHVNIDTLEVKPIDQATHGVLSTKPQTF